MKKFEYRTLVQKTIIKGFKLLPVDVEDLDYRMSELGRQGWELTKTTQRLRSNGFTSELLFIFRRELE